MKGIHDSVHETAKIDSAIIVKIFISVMLTLSIPSFVVVGIFQFTNIWNDFLFGVRVVPNPAAQPVTFARSNLSGSFSVDWNVIMADAVVAALPTVLIYFFSSRYSISGLMASSVKG